MVNYSKLFNSVYAGTRVLVTGNTGFKGSWLCFWLGKMGAQVRGLSLDPATVPNHYSLIGSSAYETRIVDINNFKKTKQHIAEFDPEIIFHLAAQPLVRYSYQQPVETFSTNVLGTVNVLEAGKHCPSLRAVVCITTDKCYENKEWQWGYREIDRLGGYDPYSASKACSELVIQSYRNSFFNLSNYGQEHSVLIASCRAGNVIGGGDWSEDRLIPDIVKATIHGTVAEVRSPSATRPWQHVLEPLKGYLLLGKELLSGNDTYADAWNFGPEDAAIVRVEEILKLAKCHWNLINFGIKEQNATVHEAALLKLDSSKANTFLKWKSTWDIDAAIKKTVDWYRNYYSANIINTEADLNGYVVKAADSGEEWILRN